MRDHLKKNDRREISKTLAEVRETIDAIKIRLNTHNELEESEVYEWTNYLLDSDARALLTENMCRELENLPPRFKKNADRD